MAIKIVTDTTSNITIEEAKKLNIDLLGIGINFDTCFYVDQYELCSEDFYKKLINEKAFPKTSALSPKDILDVYQEAQKSNDEVLTLFISSKLSGSYSTACALSLSRDFKNICNIDTLQTAGALKILVLEACRLRDLGYSLLEIKEKIDSLKTKIKTIAILDTLQYLYKGGRLSKSSMVVGEALKLKPAIYLVNGGVDILSKARGNKKIVERVIEYVSEDEIDFSYPLYFLNTIGDKNFEYFSSKVNSSLGIIPSSLICITGAVGAHIGPNACGIIYVCK